LLPGEEWDGAAGVAGAVFYVAPIRHVTEPANIRIRLMRISCAKSVGCGLHNQN